jgi:hypothetical protein
VLVKQGCPNAVNSESLVQKVYVVGEEDQTSINMGDEVSNRGYQILQL